ncbi:MAG: metal-dependent hydrolase [Methylococcales bacterium]
MPTVLTHPAVPLAIGLGLGRELVAPRLMVAGVVASIVPDLDVIAFPLGIPYEAEFGHRGFSHSLLFAFGIAFLGTALLGHFRTRFRPAFMTLFASAASHGILDAFTNGGLGIALFWPMSAERFFAPVRMIEVSPLNLSSLLSQRGLDVLESELLWVWLPCLFFGLLLRIARIVFSIRQGQPE